MEEICEYFKNSRIKFKLLIKEHNKKEHITIEYFLSTRIMTDAVVCPYFIPYNKYGKSDIDVYFNTKINQCFKYGEHSVFFNKVVPLYDIQICVLNGFKTHLY